MTTEPEFYRAIQSADDNYHERQIRITVMGLEDPDADIVVVYEVEQDERAERMALHRYAVEWHGETYFTYSVMPLPFHMDVLRTVWIDLCPGR